MSRSEHEANQYLNAAKRVEDIDEAERFRKAFEPRDIKRLSVEHELNLWKKGWELIYKAFLLTGVFATIMFVLGYLWASTNYNPPKMCTPTLLDRILK